MTKSMIKLLKAKKVNALRILSFSVHSFLSNLMYLAMKHMSNLIPKMSNLILSYSNPNGDELNPYGKSFNGKQLPVLLAQGYLIQGFQRDEVPWPPAGVTPCGAEQFCER